MKRYRAVFLSNLQHNIDYVYSQAQQQEIAELLILKIFMILIFLKLK